MDTPPGTSDEHLSIVQYLQGGGLDGAVVVTTPQEVTPRLSFNWGFSCLYSRLKVLVVSLKV